MLKRLQAKDTFHLKLETEDRLDPIAAETKYIM